MSDSFGSWFEYDLNANRRVLEVIENNIGHLPDDTLRLFSHIIAAHNIWNVRVNGATRTYNVWERIPVSEMAAAMEKNFNDSMALIEKIAEGKEYEYVNTAGDTYKNTIPDIFFHVLTHSHYHRGQIARNLREHNIDPPDTNYIVFRR